jgi:hypothetical protein
MGSGGIAPPFLASPLDAGEWSASRASHFIPRHPLDRRLDGPQSWYRRYEVDNNLLPLPGIELRLPSPQPVALHDDDNDLYTVLILGINTS